VLAAAGTAVGPLRDEQLATGCPAWVTASDAVAPATLLLLGATVTVCVTDDVAALAAKFTAHADVVQLSVVPLSFHTYAVAFVHAAL